MTAQIVVEGLSKRYQLGQRAALPRLDIKAHALNVVRRLRDASVEEISGVPGVGRRTAEAVHASLAGNPERDQPK